MRLADITAVVLTFDEKENIARCLERLAPLGRVLVIDSGSRDETAALARGFANVTVVERPFDDFAGQCNFAVGLVETPWVMSLDADYILPPALFAELEGTDEAGFAAFSVRFSYLVHGKPLRGNLYPPRPVLFRKGAARYFQDGHAHRLEVDGAVRGLDAVVAHDDRKPIGRWLASQVKYAHDDDAKRPARGLRGLGGGLRRSGVLNPFLMLFYCLFVKGLILDGWPGVFYCFQRCFFELVVALRVLDRRAAK